jgi:hypothetical protein
VRIGDVARSGGSEQQPDGRGVRPIERNQIGCLMPAQSDQANLPDRRAHGLGQRRCRNRDPAAPFPHAGEQRDE